MDGASTFRVERIGGRARFHYRRAFQSRGEWIAYRCDHLVNKFRNNRKRPPDRDRSHLRFALRSRDHLLAKLVAAAALALPDLDRAMDLSGARSSRQGPPASDLLLCGDCCRALAGARNASAFRRTAFCWHSIDGGDLFGVGGALP